MVMVKSFDFYCFCWVFWGGVWYVRVRVRDSGCYLQIVIRVIVDSVCLTSFQRKLKAKLRGTGFFTLYIYSFSFLFHESLFIFIISGNYFGCRNPEFHQSVKELKEKAEELKGVKDELKVR